MKELHNEINSLQFMNLKSKSLAKHTLKLLLGLKFFTSPKMLNSVMREDNKVETISLLFVYVNEHRIYKL